MLTRSKSKPAAFAGEFRQKFYIFKKIPTRNAKGKICEVSPATQKVVQLTRAAQVNAGEIAKLFEHDSNVILRELRQHDLCHEILTEDSLPAIMYVILYQLPITALSNLVSGKGTETSDSVSEEGDDGVQSTVDNLVEAIVLVLKAHADLSLSHVLKTIEHLHNRCLSYFWDKADAEMKNHENNEETEKNKSTERCAYIRGMASEVIPLAAECLAAKLRISSARKHYYVKAVVSGSLKVATRMALAFVTTGASEAGIGKALTNAIPVFDFVGLVVADVSVTQKKVDVQRFQTGEYELQMQVNAARIDRNPKWPELHAYVEGRECIKSLGNNYPDVRASHFRLLQTATNTRFKPSFIPHFLKNMPAPIDRITVMVTQNPVEEVRLAKREDRNSEEFVLERVQRDGQALRFATRRVASNPEIVEAALLAEYELFERLTDLQGLKRLMKYPDSPFAYAGKSLHRHERLMYWIKLDHRVFNITREQGRSKEFYHEALVANPNTAIYATPELWDDKEYALEAVFSCWGNYEMVSSKLKRERDFRLRCCKLHPDAIMELALSDKEFILDALEQKPDTINWLDDEYFEDVEFLVKALQKSEKCWYACDMDLAVSPPFMAAVMKRYGGAFFKDLPYDIRDDITYARMAVEVDPMMFEHVGLKMKTNPKLAVMAVRGNPEALKLVSEDLKASPEFKSMMESEPGPERLKEQIVENST